MRHAGRLATMLAGMWAGLLLCVGAMAAPTAFATLALPDAGRYARSLLAQEAYVSLAMALLLFIIERQRSREAAEAGAGRALTAELLLILGAFFCTVAGYFAVLPLMEAARAGQGRLSFGALHGISSVFFLVKGVLVLVLAWRLAAPARLRPTSS